MGLQDILAYVLVGSIAGVFIYLAIASRKGARAEKDKSKKA